MKYQGIGYSNLPVRKENDTISLIYTSGSTGTVNLFQQFFFPSHLFGSAKSRQIHRKKLVEIFYKSIFVE